MTAVAIGPVRAVVVAPQATDRTLAARRAARAPPSRARVGRPKRAWAEARAQGAGRALQVGAVPAGRPRFRKTRVAGPATTTRLVVVTSSAPGISKYAQTRHCWGCAAFVLPRPRP